jgi:hypothetical protein
MLHGFLGAITDLGKNLNPIVIHLSLKQVEQQ